METGAPGRFSSVSPPAFLLRRWEGSRLPACPLQIPLGELAEPDSTCTVSQTS